MSLILRLSLGETGDVSDTRRPMRLEPGAGRFTYGRALRWCHKPGTDVGRVYSVLSSGREQPVWHAALDTMALMKHTSASPSELQCSPAVYLQDEEPDRHGIYPLGPYADIVEFSLVPVGALPNTAVKLLPATTIELGTDGKARHPLVDGHGGEFWSVCPGWACERCEAIDRGEIPAASAATLARLKEADKRFSQMQRQRLLTMGGGTVTHVA